MISQEDTIRVIISETERLKQYVNGLTRDDLRKSTPCEDWNVGELIAHLVWFAQTYGGMIVRGLSGDVSIPEGFQSVPFKGSAISEAYSKAAIDLRQKLGQELIAAFSERFDQLDHVLLGIGPEDWGKPCYHQYMAVTRTVDSYLPTIIQELAVHDWDLRSSLDTSLSMSMESIPVLMEKLPSNRRPWNSPFQITSVATEPIRYGFQMDGIAGGGQDIVVEGGKAHLENREGGDANLTLIGRAGTFVLLMYGRLTLDSAIAAKLFIAEGDLGMIRDFDRWLNTDG